MERSWTRRTGTRYTTSMTAHRRGRARRHQRPVPVVAGPARDRRRAGREGDAHRDCRRDRQGRLVGVAGGPRPQHRRGVPALPGARGRRRSTGTTQDRQTGAHTVLRAQVEQGLGRRLSPEQISDRLKREFPDDGDAGEPRDDLPGAVRAGPRRAAPRADQAACAPGGPAAQPRRQPGQRRAPVRRPDGHDQRAAGRGRGPGGARALGGRPDHRQATTSPRSAPWSSAPPGT